MKDVLKNTFDMIHSLNRSSFIEGIETKEEYEKFLKYNCNYIQGFFFSKPIPEEEFIEFIKSNYNKK
jgi:EAL domain-containing protein (putative c-di-GMP-specific phosphodiesterase class I)